MSRDRRDRGGSRIQIGLLIAVALLLVPAAIAGAQDFRFFRIGTGSVGGTYFPIGSLLANAISSPVGAPPCEQGGSCGVPGMIAVAQASGGSVDNVENIASGQIESGLAQADIAYWAQTGTGLFAGREPMTDLRAIANLYTELLHLIVSADSDIEGFADLAGRRVAVGVEGSGTLLDAKLLLSAFGLDESAIEPVYAGPDAAGEMLLEGELDALLFVGGPPVLAIADLARRMPIRLVPLAGPEIDALLAEQSFFTPEVIEPGTYAGIDEPVPTIGVGALWLVDADIEDETVYQITRALWHPQTNQLLDGGHPSGTAIDLATALHGVSVPLHPGAARYYREIEEQEAPVPAEGDVPAEPEDGPPEPEAADPAESEAAPAEPAR